MDENLANMIKKDFSDVCKRALEAKDERDEVYVKGLGSLSINDTGAAWFLDKYGYWGSGSLEKSLGAPEDYLEITAGYESAKDFIGKTLDKGKLIFNLPKSDFDIASPSEYIGKIYAFCENEEVREIIGTSFRDLLVEELDRDFQPLSEDRATHEQYYRLLGLLEIAQYEECKECFEEVFDLLIEKFKDGNFPEQRVTTKTDYGFEIASADVGRHILSAIASVQTGEELKDFWKERIIKGYRGNEIFSNGISSFLKMYEGQEEKRKHLPEILEIYDQEKAGTTDKNHEDNLATLKLVVNYHCFLENVITINDDGQGVKLCYIESQEHRDEEYIFKLKQQSADSINEFSVMYDAKNDVVSHPEHLDLVQKHLKYVEKQRQK